MKKSIECYETLLLINPVFTKQQINETIDGYNAFLKELGTAITAPTDYGRRTLAYPIKNLDTAHFFQIMFLGNGDIIKQLQIKFGRDEDILRTIITKVA